MPEISDVVPATAITDEWGNAIRDRTLQRYDNPATRDSENAAPSAGELAFLEDTGSIQVYFNAAWRYLIPIGTVVPFAGTSTPPGWLHCQGQAVSRTTYAALFAEIGEAYGEGDGTTTFNLPDLRQRFPLGKAASGTGNTLGATGGSINHTHTGPSHTHTNPATNSGGSHSHTQGATGTSGSAHTHQLVYQTSQAGGLWHLTDDVVGSDIEDLRSTSRHFGGGQGGNADTDNSGSHTHNNPSVNSNGSHTHSQGSTGASGTGNTGSANPPFLVLNYLIKAA